MTSPSWTNGLIILVGVVSFVLGLIPNFAEENYKNLLLFASPAILAIACVFISLENQDKIIERIEEIEKRLKNAEDLVIIRGDIEYLKNEQKRKFYK